MPNVTIHHSDGEYHVRVLSDAEVAEATLVDAPESEAAYVEESVLRAWRRHADDHAAWNAHWRAIDNELHAQRRIAALRPLEDAERKIQEQEAEIARLTAELEVAAWRDAEDAVGRRRCATDASHDAPAIPSSIDGRMPVPIETGARTAASRTAATVGLEETRDVEAGVASADASISGLVLDADHRANEGKPGDGA